MVNLAHKTANNNWQWGTPLEAARTYRGRGWTPVVIPWGEKGPVEKGWQKTSWEGKEEEFNRAFSKPCNVGILLGKPSGGLVEADCDCKEAVFLARYLLPETDLTSGRENNPQSHYWNPHRALRKFP